MRILSLTPILFALLVQPATAKLDTPDVLVHDGITKVTLQEPQPRELLGANVWVKGDLYAYPRGNLFQVELLGQQEVWMFGAYTALEGKIHFRQDLTNYGYQSFPREVTLASGKWVKINGYFRKMSLRGPTQVVFHEGAGVQSVHPQSIRGRFKVGKKTINIDIENNDHKFAFEFFRDGRLKQAPLDEPYSFRVNGDSIDIKTFLQVDRAGKLRRAVLKGPAQLTLADGTQVNCKRDTLVAFDEKGHLVDADEDQCQ